jgi:hypothetical protein
LQPKEKSEDHKQYGSRGKMEASKVKVADINNVNCCFKKKQCTLKEVKIDKLWFFSEIQDDTSLK